MIEVMMQVHMTEAEIAGNFGAALEKQRQGLEVVVESEHLPVAVLRAAEMPRRKTSEILALMTENPAAVMDADFARDAASAIESHRESLDTTKWD